MATSSPVGLASAQAFGNPIVSPGVLTLAPTGIPTALALGQETFIFTGGAIVGNQLFNSAAEGFLSGEIDWDSGTIRVALVRWYTFNPAHRTVGDIIDSGGVFYFSSPPLTGKTAISGKADANDTIIPSVGLDGSPHYLVVFQSSDNHGGPDVAEPEQRLIAWIDSATNLPISPTGSDISIIWDNGSLGIFTIWRSGVVGTPTILAQPTGTATAQSFGTPSITGLLTVSPPTILSPDKVSIPTVPTNAAAPTLVGQLAASLPGTGGSLTYTYSATAGNLVVVSSTTTGASTISDTGGNTWFQVASTADAGATGQRIGQVWFSFLTSSFTAVTVAGATTSRAGLLTEWAGAKEFADSDMTAGSPSTNIVDVRKNDLVIATNYRFNTIEETPPTGFTALTFIAGGSSVNYAHSSAYKIAANAANNETIAYGVGNAGRVAAVFRGDTGGTFMRPDPFGTEEAFGTPRISIAFVVTPVGIASTEAFGTPLRFGPTTVTAVGIPTAAIVGTPGSTPSTTPPALIQQTGLGSLGTTSSFDIPFTPTTGNAVIISAQCNGDAVVSAGSGNTWIEIASTLDVGATDQRKGQLFYCLDVNPFTNITLTSPTSGAWAVNVSEWSGIRSVTDTSNVTGVSTVNEVDTQVSNLVIATNYRFGTVAETNPAPPSAWTPMTFAVGGTSGNYANSNVYKIASVVATDTIAFGVGNAGRIAAVFSGLPGPGGGLTETDPVVLQAYFDGARLPRPNTSYSVEIHNTSKSYSCNVATNRTSLEYFEVRSGDIWHGLGTERSEFSGPSGIAYGSDIWLSMNLMIYPGTSYSTWNVIGQLHGTSGTSPIFVQEWQNGVFYIKTRHDRNGAGVYTTTNRYSMPLVRGQKYNIVHHLNISRTGNGLLQTWIDGVKVVDIVVPIGYNLAGTPYWKHGIYRSQAAPAARIRYANFEIKTDGTSLLTRVTNPLPDPDPAN